MSASHRQRLGLLVVALDTQGREALDQLVERPEVRGAPADCHHVEYGDSGEVAAFTWRHRTPASDWNTPLWAQGGADFANCLEGAVRHMLDVARWQTLDGGAVDLLDVVILASWADTEADVVPPQVTAAIEAVQQRFRKIARVLLVTEGEYRTIGKGAARGLIEPLPDPDGEAGGVFDLVVLLDQVNTEGLVLADPAEARARTAAAIVHLTVGELAPVLYRSIQTELARMGSQGRYLTLGLSEWRLRGKTGVAAMSNLLYRRMCDRLTAADRASPPNAALPPDPWIDKTSTELQESKEDEPRSLLGPFQRRGNNALWEVFRASRWNLALLERLLERRSEELKRLEALTTKRLLTFMERFAPWYRGKRLGEIKRDKSKPELRSVTKPHHLRRTILTVCVILFLGGTAGALVNGQDPIPFWIAAGVGALGALFTLALGLNITETELGTDTEIDEEPDKELELRRLRNQRWLAGELVKDAKSSADGVSEAHTQLHGDAEVPTGASKNVFPYSPELCAGLLDSRSLDAEESLRRFWQEADSGIEAMLAEWGNVLPEQLRSYATRRCEDQRGIHWADVFEATGGPRALEKPVWREPLEKAQNHSLPWLPVTGHFSKTVLGLPSDLPTELREALIQRFSGQKIVDDLQSGDILIVQVAQGYSTSESS